jgi:pilus assembly protein CpaF
MRELVKSSLRMRPDRIIIGEVRGSEALDLLQAMNTGHSGSMTTVHANNPMQTMSRLETLAMMSEVQLPHLAIKNQIASAIDIVIQVSRLRDGSRKVTHISEVVELDLNGHYVINDIFVNKILSTDDTGKIHSEHMATGVLPSFHEESKVQGFKVSKKWFGFPDD